MFTEGDQWSENTATTDNDRGQSIGGRKTAGAEQGETLIPLLRDHDVHKIW